ncbi:NUDIX domain-containing protein [archaeon]|jgi:8-oxo-dGTP diphosphatase|nr:NUDIX domain-containing protein [archaeon]MBT4021847.1 NUDIX domain-containing protein [archaeon]MBT4272142.1 NUDIX domain-containing protein [archaeon]MBT4460323.1 NUDIX domain-containing protein [archaeon]MBT4858947.1 NUDIX domain-containing protein [archaeon]
MEKDRQQSVPASYLILIRHNMVLLLKRKNTGYEDGNYSMVAGHVDAGETFTDAIIREAREEAGIIIDPKKIKVVHVMHRDSKSETNNERVDVYFLAEEWGGKLQNMEPRKCEELEWFELYDLPSNTIPYIKHAIDCFNKNIFYSEFGWKK